MDGMKGRYISLQRTSIQTIQIDMQGRIGTQRRNGELLHGNFVPINVIFSHSKSYQKMGLNEKYRWNKQLIVFLLCLGVIGYYGMEEACISYLMFVASRGSQIIDQFIAYS